MVVLDTSAVIDLGKGNLKLKKLLSSDEFASSAFEISLATIFELSAGDPPGLNEMRRKLLIGLEQIEISFEILVNAGILFRNLKKQGLEIQAFDAIIAATAISINEPIITANEKHFNRISRLRVIGYKT